MLQPHTPPQCDVLDPGLALTRVGLQLHERLEPPEQLLQRREVLARILLQLVVALLARAAGLEVAHLHLELELQLACLRVQRPDRRLRLLHDDDDLSFSVRLEGEIHAAGADDIRADRI